MLEIGRARAATYRGEAAITFAEANAEALPFADRSFDAATIAFGIRNVPRIEAALAEAFRVLKIGGKFVCLEFSSVDVPALDRLYDFYSFNVIPALGRVVAGDAESYRYLVESIRRFPKPQAFAAMLRAAGFVRVLVPGNERRHRDIALRLAFVISAPAHLVRLARAGFVFAREGVSASSIRWWRRSGPPADTNDAAVGAARHRSGGNAAVGGADQLGPAMSSSGNFLRLGPTWLAPRWRAILKAYRIVCRLFPSRSRDGDRCVLRPPVGSVFATFGPPVAAASIAQVHRATVVTATGTRASP